MNVGWEVLLGIPFAKGCNSDFDDYDFDGGHNSDGHDSDDLDIDFDAILLLSDSEDEDWGVVGRHNEVSKIVRACLVTLIYHPAF